MVISPRYDQYNDAWDTSVAAEVCDGIIRVACDALHFARFELSFCGAPADQSCGQVRESEVFPLLQAWS